MVEGRVKCWAGVSFGEDDAVVSEVPGVVGMELKPLLVEEEHGDDVCDGRRRCGMARFRHMNGSCRVYSDLVANVFPEGIIAFHPC